MGRRRQFDHDQIVELYKSGYTPREIADRVGANPDYVGKLITKAGVARKSGRPKRVVRCLSCGSTDTRSEIV